jgi:hypothetical protein
MKKSVVIILFIIFIFSCKSISDHIHKNDQAQNPKIKSEEIDGKKVDFIFTGAPRNENGNNVLRYEVQFRIKLPYDDVIVSYMLYDEDGNTIRSSGTIKPGIINALNKEYFLKEYFTDKYCFSKIKYILRITGKNMDAAEYKGEYTDLSLPLTEIKIGPMLTKNIGEKLHVSMMIDVSIDRCNNIKWIHFIPPTMDSYWDLPSKKSGSKINAAGSIYEKNKNYLNNGLYILQVNLGLFGFREKKINIIDLYNNTKGPNYGLPVAYERSQDKHYIKLDIDLLEKIEHLELWIYKNIQGEDQKIGIAKFLTPSPVISKNELKDMIIDDFGNKMKIRYNDIYSYVVYLYSGELSGLKYVSISKAYTFEIKGFNFFDL